MHRSDVRKKDSQHSDGSGSKSPLHTSQKNSTAPRFFSRNGGLERFTSSSAVL